MNEPTRRTVCIHQPDFAPWLGFFDRLALADMYVVLDTVQYLRQGWHNRDKIKTAQGAAWLTVPVKNKGRYRQSILETELDNDRDWRTRHMRTLRAAYGKALHFKAISARLEEIYARGHARLIDFNMAIIRFLIHELGIDVEIRFASELGVGGRSNQLLIEIMRAVGGGTYITGLGSKSYLDESAFDAAGIKVTWRKYDHPTYDQLFGDFVPGLSALDCLFNCGASSVEIFKT